MTHICNTNEITPADAGADTEAIEIINALDEITNDETGKHNAPNGVCIPDSLLSRIYEQLPTCNACQKVIPALEIYYTGADGMDYCQHCYDYDKHGIESDDPEDYEPIYCPVCSGEAFTKEQLHAQRAELLKQINATFHTTFTRIKID